MKKLDIPFIKSRGFECGQTCTAMMIKYFKSDFKPDFDEFNKIIHFKKHTSTFPQQNAILLDHYGIHGMSFSSDNISTSTEDSGQFKRWFGKDYEHAIQTIDIPSFDWMVREFRKKKLFTRKTTDFSELLKLFNKGYLVCLPVNWNILENKDGPFDGHFIIISGIDGDSILIHDPDVGPFIKYPKVQLQKAWGTPPITDDYFVAYGLK